MSDADFSKGFSLLENLSDVDSENVDVETHKRQLQAMLWQGRLLALRLSSPNHQLSSYFHTLSLPGQKAELQVLQDQRMAEGDGDFMTDSYLVTKVRDVLGLMDED
jgi:hypothetical protein